MIVFIIVLYLVTLVMLLNVFVTTGKGPQFNPISVACVFCPIINTLYLIYLLWLVRIDLKGCISKWINETFKI